VPFSSRGGLGLQGLQGAEEGTPSGWKHFDEHDISTSQALGVSQIRFHAVLMQTIKPGLLIQKLWSDTLEQWLNATLGTSLKENLYVSRFWKTSRLIGYFIIISCTLWSVCKKLLLIHGVFCQKCPRLSRRQALAEFLLQDACVQLGPEEEESDSGENTHEGTGADEIHTERAPEQRLVKASLPPQMDRNSQGSPQNLSTDDCSKKECEIGNVVVEEASTRRNSRRPLFRAYDDDPEDDAARHCNSGTLIKMYQSRNRSLGH
jgi:hypothetical protein